MRTNERAAAALGISVFGVKLYAFAFGAAIAAIGGVILTFRTTTVAYSDYTPLASILAVAYTVIGGVGYVLGAPFGSQLVQGGFGTWLLDSFPWWGVLVLGGLFAFLGALLARALRGGDASRHQRPRGARRDRRGVAALLGGSWIVLAFKNGPGDGWRSSVFTNPNPSWLTVIGGLTVTLLIVIHPDGAVSVNAELFAKLSAALRRITRRPEREVRVPPLPDVVREPVEPGTLEASNITVRFGGVVAVNDVSVTVNAGEIVGLIGPNGAGKTTLIDAITGFVKPANGSIHMNGEAVDSLPVYKRARGGISRSFQQLELFESSTVRENLMVASDGYSHAAVRDRHRPADQSAALLDGSRGGEGARARSVPRRASSAISPTVAAASSRSPARSPSRRRSSCSTSRRPASAAPRRPSSRRSSAAWRRSGGSASS